MWRVFGLNSKYSLCVCVCVWLRNQYLFSIVAPSFVLAVRMSHSQNGLIYRSPQHNRCSECEFWEFVSFFPEWSKWQCQSGRNVLSCQLITVFAFKSPRCDGKGSVHVLSLAVNLSKMLQVNNLIDFQFCFFYFVRCLFRFAATVVVVDDAAIVFFKTKTIT